MSKIILVSQDLTTGGGERVFADLFHLLEEKELPQEIIMYTSTRLVGKLATTQIIKKILV